MAFNPLKKAGLTEQQNALFNTIIKDLDTFSTDIPYVSKKIASKNELKLYKHIFDNFENVIISMQVHMLRIVNVDAFSIIKEWKENGCPPHGYGDLKKFFSLIDKLSLDFVISDSEGKVLLVIELDGPEHEIDFSVIEKWVIDSSVIENWNGNMLIEAPVEVKAWYRDRFKTDALSNAGINLLRIKNEEIGKGANLSFLTCKIRKYLSQV